MTSKFRVTRVAKQQPPALLYMRKKKRGVDMPRALQIAEQIQYALTSRNMCQFHVF